MIVNKTTALAILIALTMIGVSFAVVGESQALTPQTGSVNLTIYYPALSKVGSSSTTVTMKDFSGNVVSSQSGNSVTFSGIQYGKYYIDVNPFYGPSGSSGTIVANETVKPINLTSPSMSLTMDVSTAKTVKENIDVQGITSGSANVSLQTDSGFTFKSFTMNETSHNQSAYVPYGSFYVNANYAGSAFSSYVTTTTTGATVKENLSTATTLSGFVKDQSGSPVSPVDVVVYNPASRSYTTSHFTGASYTIEGSLSGMYVFISSPGYNTTQILNPSSGGLHNAVLHKASSSIFYNYSLSSNLQSVSLNITYRVGNNTTIPYFLGNSTVGSLYWQESLDGFTTGNLQTMETLYLKNLVMNYTSNSFTLNGYVYNFTEINKIAASGSTLGSFNGFVNVSYSNPSVPSSLGTSGYTAKIGALATQMTPGTLYNNYSLTYDNPVLALASSSSSTSTFKSPIVINPVSTSQQVSLSLSPVQKPAVQDSQIALYWTGLSSSNYLLNNSATNTAFIAPQSTPVNLNASNSYFNPVTGKNDYQYANFTWYMGGSNYYGYNTTMSFSAAKTLVTLNATSPSGSYNNSSFYVITSNANPTVNYSVTYSGKTLASGMGLANASVTVPQSALVTYSGFPSSLNVSGYSVPLLYAWYMPNYTSTAQNITYAFDNPAVSVGTQYAYLNVSTVFGTYANQTFLVTVNDTTPPVPAMKLSNLTHTSVSQPTAGVPTVFSANSSTDPYYAGSQLTYSWAVNYANGTSVKNGSTTYEVAGGSMNGSYVILKFNTLTPLIVSLKATNPSGVAAYSNNTVSIQVNTPRIVVNSIYMSSNLTQGSKTTIYVNVSNNGTVAANGFTIMVLINNNQVASQDYSMSLAVGQARNVSFNYTPATSGKVTLVFEANNSSQPAFMSNLGSYTTTLSIKAPGYKTPLIIGSIIAVIVIVGLVYYRVTSSRPKKQRQAKPKTDLKKQPAEKKK